jgi:hypothetical protein
MHAFVAPVVLRLAWPLNTGCTPSDISFTLSLEKRPIELQNGGPLSLCIARGSPCSWNTLSITGHALRNPVDGNASQASRYRLTESISVSG